MRHRKAGLHRQQQDRNPSKVLQVEPRNLLEINPVIPRFLWKNSRTFSSAMAKDPVERYQSASALLEDLRRLAKLSIGSDCVVLPSVSRHPSTPGFTGRAGTL